MAARRRVHEPLARAGLEALHSISEDLAGAFELRPLLERIVRRSIELLGADAGSICSVDEAAGSYRKEADVGVDCQSGQVFPLTEGMTGAVARERGPVRFADYRLVPGGHVHTADRATLRGVLGVPIRWRNAVIGVCVVFSRDPSRQFTEQDAGLLELFAQHAAIALTNARLYADADVRARAEATAAERERLVREVHDTVARGLVSVLVQLDAVSSGGRAAQPGVEQAREAAVLALAETRRTALGLAPSPLEGRTLEEALELELAWARRTGSLDVRLVAAGERTTLPDTVAHQLFRIAQEALTNAVQHAGARTVRIGIVYKEAGTAVLVEDDGKGFEQSGSAAGLGLRGMHERARVLGGTLEVESVPGWGTRVRATAPADGGQARRVRVVLAAPNPIVRAGVTRLLAWQEPGVEVIGEVDSAPAAADACRLLLPDVVLVHVELGAAVELCAAVRPDPPAVLVLCPTGDEDRAHPLLRAGASGWIADDTDGAGLARALLAAAQGQAVLPAGALHEPVRPALTKREEEVFRLLRLGLRDKQIAEQLLISAKTVEKHVGSILRKCGAHTRTELVALGHR